MDQSKATSLEATFDIPISIVMEKIEADQKWSLDRWNLIGVVLENGREPNGEIFKANRRRYFCWPRYWLSVHARHVKSYAANLQTGNPKLFVVCRADDDGLIYPITLSTDVDEAAAYMETDEPVFSCPLPKPVIAWLENFLDQSHNPTDFHKRRRKPWHANDARDLADIEGGR